MGHNELRQIDVGIEIVDFVWLVAEIYELVWAGTLRQPVWVDVGLVVRFFHPIWNKFLVEVPQWVALFRVIHERL